MSEARVGTDLLARLRAAIDETERVARTATRSGCREWVAVGDEVLYDRDLVVVSGLATEHIARHDPASVLRRCAADRKILELHSDPYHACPGEQGCGHPWREMSARPGICRSCEEDAEPCPTIVALAAGYGIEDVNG